MGLGDKLRARRAGATEPPIPPVEEPDAGHEASAATATPPPTPAATGPDSTGEALYLYVDCAPTKGSVNVLSLEEEIATRSKALLEEAKAKGIQGSAEAVDVRELDFGKGTAALVASFQKDPVRGHVVAHSGGLSTQVVEVLVPQATAVVRGGR